MDEVVHGVDSDERRRDRGRLQHVAPDDLGRRRDPWLQVLGPARETTDRLTALLERVKEPASHIAGGAGEQDQSLGSDATSLDAPALFREDGAL
jgi:hypothetical protein